MATVLPRPQPAGQAGHALRTLGSETAKGLQVTWSHKATLLPQFGFLAFLYLIIQYFVGAGRIVSGLAPQTFIAFLAFVVGYVALLRMAAGVLEEVFTGTFMQSLLSPLRPWVLVTGRLFAAVAEGLLTALVISALFIPLLSIRIPLRWEALIPLVLTVADAAGFALLIGGLAIVINSIGAVVHVLWNVMFMLNGSFIPVDAFPVWLEVVAKIWPTTLGVDATRQVLFQDAGLADLWSDLTLQWAIGHAALMLLLGWLAFSAGIRRGMKRGRLGP